LGSRRGSRRSLFLLGKDERRADPADGGWRAPPRRRGVRFFSSKEEKKSTPRRRASGHCAAARLGATHARASAAREGDFLIARSRAAGTSHRARRLPVARRALEHFCSLETRGAGDVFGGASFEDERPILETTSGDGLPTVSATHFSPAAEPRVDPRGSNAQHHGATARRASARADSTLCEVDSATRSPGARSARRRAEESGARALSIETCFERIR
jgi:hypothetical protein